MKIQPFEGFRFNGDKVGNVGDCISPPYDVINEKLQQTLYNKNDHNIVRIIQGKATKNDSDSNDKYTRAAKFFNDWIKEKALKKDDHENIYGYVQNFVVAGEDFQRLSFISLAKLEEFGEIVRPHEKVLKNPIVGRLKLQTNCKAKFGQVFMLYDDPKHVADKYIQKAIAEQKSEIDFVDEQNVRHRLFLINDKKQIQQIIEMMKDKSVVIADGHHRYTTALKYAEINEPDKTSYQMLTFANTCHKGLIVLATHRLVKNLENFSCEKLIKKLKTAFNIETFDNKNAMLTEMKNEGDKNENAFGVYADEKFYLAVLNDKEAMEKVAEDKSEAWKNLDVAVLHKLILENLLEIDEEKMANQTNVNYLKDTPNAIDDMLKDVDNQKAQAAFFMNPPKLKQIEQVADAGERMPQKSTYFFPKIYTGLVIDKL